MRELTRREFIVGIGTLVGLEVARRATKYYKESKLTEGPLCDEDLRRARLHEHLRDDFCDKLYESEKERMPYCSGIPYDADHSKKVEYLKQSCEILGSQKVQEICEEFRNEAVQKYSINLMTTCIPAHLLGSRMKSPIFVEKRLFEDSVLGNSRVAMIETIDEVLSYLHHEYIHVTDAFEGIKIDDNLVITSDTFEHTPVTWKFTKAVFEARAYYGQLTNLPKTPRVREIFKRVPLNPARQAFHDLSLYDSVFFPEFAPYAKAQLAKFEGVEVKFDQPKFKFLGE